MRQHLKEPDLGLHGVLLLLIGMNDADPLFDNFLHKVGLQLCKNIVAIYFGLIVRGQGLDRDSAVGSRILPQN